MALYGTTQGPNVTLTEHLLSYKNDRVKPWMGN